MRNSKLVGQTFNCRLHNTFIWTISESEIHEGSKKLIGEFLKKVSEILGRQIILITHDRILMEIGDKIFYVKIKEGLSKIEEISDLSEIDEI